MTPGDSRLRDAIFALGPHIRYVGLGRGQHVETKQRSGLSDASDSSSDFFEELLVNPALLVLARQRGELDCGGLRYVVVGYGSFDQLVVPLADGGHVSVCIEREADLDAVVADVLRVVERAAP